MNYPFLDYEEYYSESGKMLTRFEFEQCIERGERVSVVARNTELDAKIRYVIAGLR